MRVWDRLRQLDRLQRSRPFRVVVSIAVAVVTLGVLGWIVLGQAADAAQRARAEDRTGQRMQQSPGDAQPGQGEAVEDDAGLTAAERAIETMLAVQDDPTGAMVGVALTGGVAVAVVWLGLGLTYFGLAVAGAAVVYPLMLLGASDDLVLLLAGLLTLTGAFTALMRGLGELFALPSPVFAVARNVLAEAVRLKLSVVFIVMLVIGLSTLPALLDEGEELRYRVQSFLQYGTGGAFWIIALLTVLFGVASVTFEQRDRLIWQTMTKPVAAWQYLLGKWLGVVGLSGALLGVSASGVFLMVDYLRNQPAMEEIAPYVSGDRNTPITEDRLLLESQVLTARRSSEPEPPFGRDDPAFLESVREFIETERLRDETFAATDEQFEEVVDDLYKSSVRFARQVDPGRSRVFEFTGLGPARSVDRPLTLAYKIDAPGAIPTTFYQIGYEVEGERYYRFFKDQVAVTTTHTLTIPNDAIDREGRLLLRVTNAGVTGTNQWRAFSFTPDGLELSYSTGGFHANYLRVVLVLWIKLAFLAMIAVCLSTILSFPVACLVGLTVFVSAEASGFLAHSIEMYGTTDREGNPEAHRIIVTGIGSVVTWLFGVYADLRPTTRLVEGRELSWTRLGGGLAVLGVATAGLYALAVAVFRKRELAMYSGH